jgi:TetR/AcrR family transcriptional regulator, transcriptional repressor for nem operon
MSDSKEHIIKIASKLFLQKSFKEVTMKDIVTQTGLSKGAFYHYFESKEQLFLEVLDFFFTDVMTHAYTKYSKESLYKFYHDYANEINSNEYFALMGNEIDGGFNVNYFMLAFDALKLFPEFRKKMIAGFDIELGIWSGVIKTARENGEIKSSMTDEEIAKTFIYLSDGIAMHMIMRGCKIEEMIKPVISHWDKLYEQIKA